MLGFYPLSGAPISGLPSRAFVSFISPWRRVLQMQAPAVDDEESQQRTRLNPNTPLIISARYVITMIIG